jgi:hypothetical protein
LTLTGANSGERRETPDPKIQLKQAGLGTAANSDECKETSSGSVSEGSNPSPAARDIPAKKQKMKIMSTSL